jgi:hypothetical protein
MDTTLATPLTGNQDSVRSWRERIDGALASLKDDLLRSECAGLGPGRENPEGEEAAPQEEG